MTFRPHFLLLAAALLAGSALPAAERIPPAPPRYFNDYAGVVSRPVADRLNAQLEQFERASSNQLLVAIYPRMESDSSVEDYSIRVAQAWKAGQAGKNNGAVLFAFMQSHDLYLQVGYGLEGALPDATAKRIIGREIVPRFRAGDIDGGMTAAVNAIIAAAKGEYQGTGRTVANSRQRSSAGGPLIAAALVVLLFLFFVFLQIRRAIRNPTMLLNPRRRRPGTGNTWWMGGTGGSSWGSGSSGSSWSDFSGGGGGGGGGGGFSGGGGSFGGGGAGGKW